MEGKEEIETSGALRHATDAPRRDGAFATSSPKLPLVLRAFWFWLAEKVSKL